MSVLVVDDAPSNSKMLCHALSRRGHVCVVAENGVEAVQLLRDPSKSFDIVFMDNTMPLMTGVEATRVIRQELRYDRHVIGITGNVLQDDLDQFLAAGANMVLLKPLRVSDLDLLVQHLSEHGLVCDMTQRLKINARNVLKLVAYPPQCDVQPAATEDKLE